MMTRLTSDAGMAEVEISSPDGNTVWISSTNGYRIRGVGLVTVHQRVGAQSLRQHGCHHEDRAIDTFAVP